VIPEGSAGPKRIEDLGARPEAHLVESRRRLSQSSLWTLQRAFYEHHGSDAWGKDIVPHYITCNPAIADGYAHAILAFLRDCAGAGRLAAEEPVYVVEIGSGSGRFAYLLQRRLREILSASELSDLNAPVVVTDFEESKLEALRGHPWLEAELAEGRMDLARFDAASPAALELRMAGKVLSQTANPLVVIANYVFDSLPAEAFSVRHGRLHEALVSISSTLPDADVTQPAHLESLEYSWDFEEIATAAVGDADAQAVAAAYEAELDDSVFLLPTVALDCLRFFQSMAEPHHLLALVGDKGHPRPQDLLSGGTPAVVTHSGCFSLMVNFDAMARVVRRRGGLALLPRHVPTSLVVAAFVLGDELRWRQLERSYLDDLESSGPDDTFALRTAFRPDRVAADLDLLLAYLRLSHWDSVVLLEWFSPLLDLAAAAPTHRRRDIAAAVQAVWANYFPIGEAADLPVCLGLLLSAINYYPEAIGYFMRSLDLHGPTAMTYFALAIAHLGLRDLDAAAKDAREALAIDPGFSGARNLLLQVESERPA
jgi:tetratricopeptide (TPR) repeat protein